MTLEEAIAENKRLKKENAELKQENAALESKLTAAKKTIRRTKYASRCRPYNYGYELTQYDG